MSVKFALIHREKARYTIGLMTRLGLLKVWLTLVHPRERVGIERMIIQ